MNSVLSGIAGSAMSRAILQFDPAECPPLTSILRTCDEIDARDLQEFPASLNIVLSARCQSPIDALSALSFPSKKRYSSWYVPNPLQLRSWVMSWGGNGISTATFVFSGTQTKASHPRFCLGEELPSSPNSVSPVCSITSTNAVNLSLQHFDAYARDRLQIALSTQSLIFSLLRRGKWFFRGGFRSNWRVKHRFLAGFESQSTLRRSKKRKKARNSSSRFLPCGNIAMWPLCTKLSKQLQRDLGDEANAAFSRECQQAVKKQIVLRYCWFAKLPGTSVGQKFSARVCQGMERRLGVFIGFAYLRPFRFFMNMQFIRFPFAKQLLPTANSGFLVP